MYLVEIDGVIYRISRRLLCQESEHFTGLLNETGGLDGNIITSPSPIIVEAVSEFEMETFLEFLYAS